MVKTRQRSKRWKPQIAAYQVNTYINTAAVPENTIQHKNEGYQIWRDIFKAHSWRSWGVNSMFADYIISLMIFTPPPRLFLTCPSNLQRPTNQPKTVFNGMLVASKKGSPLCVFSLACPIPTWALESQPFVSIPDLTGLPWALGLPSIWWFTAVCSIEFLSS